MRPITVQGFSKSERLTHKTRIQELFESGNSVFVFPFKVYWLPASGLSTPAEVVIAVPKRRIKKAVTRNLLKRRTREAYRLQKQSLYTSLLAQEKQIQLAIVFIAPSETPYLTISTSLGSVFEILKNKILTD